MQRCHSVGAVRQHRALVDGTFVGDLAFVDGGRFAQQAQAGNAVGAAGATLGQIIDNVLELGQHRCRGQHI